MKFLNQKFHFFSFLKSIIFKIWNSKISEIEIDPWVIKFTLLFYELIHRQTSWIAEICAQSISKGSGNHFSSLLSIFVPKLSIIEFKFQGRLSKSTNFLLDLAPLFEFLLIWQHLRQSPTPFCLLLPRFTQAKFPSLMRYSREDHISVSNTFMCNHKCLVVKHEWLISCYNYYHLNSKIKLNTF